MIALDYADSAEGLGKTARDFGIDLSALAKDWPDGGECFVERDAKKDE